MMKSYSGITWDNPRGKNALVASAVDAPNQFGINMTWDSHSLEHFESHPIDDLARRYDLIVMDHPHVGEMLESQLFSPIEALLNSAELQALEQRFVGPSLQSYRMNGKLWALPIDAATQVMALRRDLVDEVPHSWDEVVRQSARIPVALCLAGPHAFLSFLSLSASLGANLDNGFWRELPSDEVATEALEIMMTLGQRQSSSTVEMNPITMLTAMAESDVLACVPLIYGYSAFSVSEPHPITFCDVPRGTSEVLGSTIGGAGLAISVNAEITPELTSYIKWLISEDAQTNFIPQHQGQPALVSSWQSSRVNEQYGNFFKDTFHTTASSQVRPRFAGYPAFQDEASELIRSGITQRTEISQTISAVRKAFDHATSQAEKVAR